MPANILLVGTAPASFASIESLLHGLGHPLVRSSAGDDLSRLLDANDFAVVLLDTRGPEFGEFAIAKMIRERKRSRQTPILVLVAAARDQRVAVPVVRLGAVTYLVEPLAPEIVRAKIEGCAALYQEPGRNGHPDQLRFQIDRMPLGYLLSGPDFRYTRWNPAAERIFGFTEAEVLGRHPFEVLVPQESRRLVQTIFERLAGGDMDAHGQCENVTKDGRTVVCEWFNTPLFDRNGKFLGILSLAQDVTERRRLEEQFRQAQKMDAIGRLAGGVAHDLNNTLTVINGLADLMLYQLPAGDPMRESLEQILLTGERSARLTSQLLTFSRKQMVMPRVLDLNVVISDLRTMLGRLLREDVELCCELRAKPSVVVADLGQIEQVVMNLAVNARDAMPGGGRLSIGTDNAVCSTTTNGARPGPHVVLTVTDNGEGMTPDVLANAFEPFFTTKEVGKGSGLGLATVYGVVRQHGGHIEVESTRGSGTTFRVYLPAASAPSAAPQGSDSRDLLRGSETILLTEDEPSLRSMARHVLSECGYTVLEAADGHQALEICRGRSAPIDLLVTDVVMPKMGGSELADQVTAIHPTAKVLFISGYTDNTFLRDGVRHDQVWYLQKPFMPAALARKVREVLDAANGVSGR
jgi:PAS domain S-box-containing protein